MKLVLLGHGRFTSADLEVYQTPPQWRKATRNMIMATASIERALGKVPGFIDRANEDTGLVLGSSSGELDTSSEFLITLDRMKVARPLLFQNSLHNATTGFASIHFRLTGPTFSISSGLQMPRETLLMAQALLEDGVCRACLVTLVEGHRLLSGFIKESVDEGAATVLLAEAEFAASLGYESTPEFIMADWIADYPENPATAPLVAISGSQFYRQIVERE